MLIEKYILKKADYKILCKYRVGLYDQWNMGEVIVYEQVQVKALFFLGLPTLEEASHHVVKTFKALWRVHMRSS